MCEKPMFKASLNMYPPKCYTSIKKSTIHVKEAVKSTVYGLLGGMPLPSCAMNCHFKFICVFRRVSKVKEGLSGKYGCRGQTRRKYVRLGRHHKCMSEGLQTCFTNLFLSSYRSGFFICRPGAEYLDLISHFCYP